MLVTHNGRIKSPEQKVYEKRFHLDERFHIHRVIGNKGRSREKQELRRLVNELDEELEDGS